MRECCHKQASVAILHKQASSEVMQLWIKRWARRSDGRVSGGQEGLIYHWLLLECIESKDTIEQVKATVWSLDKSLAVERQKLVFNGTELRDNDCTCSHYGLGDSDHIELYEVARQKRKREET